ncbi:MAG: IS5 family transposase [Conexivisphaera sp.]
MAERDWAKYNEDLVRRGELLIDRDMMEAWRMELEEENRGKEGEPFHYPSSYMRFLATVRAIFHLPYRQTEGFVRSLARFIPGLPVPDYTTIARRTDRLEIDLDETLLRSNGPVTIAVDSTGIKAHNGGDWMTRMWRVRKGYLKLHVAVDVRTRQVVSMEMTTDEVGDGRMMRSLVEGAEGRVHVGRLLADGAYDSRENFSFLEERGIEPVIRVRRNSVPRSRGCYVRKRTVEEVLSLGRAGWSRAHGYGMRWAVEGLFSALKRIFGEHVMARKFSNAVGELLLKAASFLMTVYG